MDPATSRQALEAILFVVDEPVAASALSEVLESSQAEIEAELATLAAELEDQRRGFVLRNVAGGWRLYSAPQTAPYIERWVRGRRSGRLSRAALETLAVIAYKQPISRAEVGDIRGVNADGAMRTLVARGLIGEVRRDSGPGQAVLYGTTPRFLEDLGLENLADLPPLTRFLPPGPAPDEPSPEHQRDARAVIRAGRGLPSTGKARWEPMLDPADSEGAAQRPDDVIDSDAAEDHRAVVPAADVSPAPDDRHGDLDVLTEALERATRNALAVLESALQAVGAPLSEDSSSQGRRVSPPGQNELVGGSDLNAAAWDQEGARSRSGRWEGWGARGETDG